MGLTRVQEIRVGSMRAAAEIHEFHTGKGVDSAGKHRPVAQPINTEVDNTSDTHLVMSEARIGSSLRRYRSVGMFILTFLRPLDIPVTLFAIRLASGRLESVAYSISVHDSATLGRHVVAFCDAVATKLYGGQAGDPNLRPRREIDDDVVVWKALLDAAGVSADRITVRATHILLNNVVRTASEDLAREVVDDFLAIKFGAPVTGPLADADCARHLGRPSAPTVYEHATSLWKYAEDVMSAMNGFKWGLAHAGVALAYGCLYDAKPASISDQSSLLPGEKPAPAIPTPPLFPIPVLRPAIGRLRAFLDIFPASHDAAQWKMKRQRADQPSDIFPYILCRAVSTTAPQQPDLGTFAYCLNALHNANEIESKLPVHLDSPSACPDLERRTVHLGLEQLAERVHTERRLMPGNREGPLLRVFARLMAGRVLKIPGASDRCWTAVMPLFGAYYGHATGRPNPLSLPLPLHHNPSTAKDEQIAQLRPLVHGWYMLGRKSRPVFRV